jgi:GntR family transcriptional repressor for pyruvate dehydrogenase complex
MRDQSPDNLNFAGLAKARGARLTDEVIDALRSAVVLGEIGPGTRLPSERALAQQFGVSQPTMREAVRALEAMGLLEARHGSGAYVTGDASGFIGNALRTLMQMERVGILDVVELRLVLGKYSAARAARMATDEMIDQADAFERSLSETAQDGEYGPVAHAALAFQASVSAASRSPLLFSLETFLAEMLIAFQLSAWRADSAGFIAEWRQWRDSFQRDRRRLIEALRARDEAFAVDAMVTYLERQRTHFGSYAGLRDINLVDSDAIKAVAEAGLRPPAYRELHDPATREADDPAAVE